MKPWPLLLVLLLTHCDQLKVAQLQQPDKATGSGELRVDRSEGVDLPTFSLEGANSCRLNKKARTLEILLKGAEGNTDVAISVVGVRSQSGDYTCEQAGDNAKEQGSLGSIFDGCQIRAAIPATVHPGASDVHATSRTSTDERLFQFGGQCRVSLNPSEEELKGTFLCKKMPRVVAAGAPASNEDNLTIDVAGEFTCELEVEGESDKSDSP